MEKDKGRFNFGTFLLSCLLLTVTRLVDSVIRFVYSVPMLMKMIKTVGFELITTF